MEKLSGFRDCATEAHIPEQSCGRLNEDHGRLATYGGVELISVALILPHPPSRRPRRRRHGGDATALQDALREMLADTIVSDDQIQATAAFARREPCRQ
jgi:hypothetical protein